MRRTLHFTGDSEVKIRKEPVPSPEEDQVVIEAIISSISTGSEKLVYRGELNENIVLDKDIKALDHELQYPVKYGYSMIGEVVSTGKNVDEKWIGKEVFCFHPHESEFVADVDDLIMIPDNLDIRDFAFLPNVETAVNLILDGAPLIGENVMVIGQGVIGLLTTAILSKFPISNLITMDLLESRRKISSQLGADVVLDGDFSTAGKNKRSQIPEEGLDLIFETSGQLSALEAAVEKASFDGRIIVGSWYGDKKEKINLGTPFHRNRLNIKSSQVSSIDPKISGRWNKSRRINQAIKMIKEIEPRSLITQEMPFSEAQKVYELLDKHPEKYVQIMFKYD